MAVLRIAVARWPSADSSRRPAGPASHPLPPAGGPLAGACDWPLHSYLELQARPASVSRARDHAKAVLSRWHVTGLTDTVELLVSEIATNAIRASDPALRKGHRTRAGPARQPRTIRLWLMSDRDRVMVQMWDADHRQPVRRHADRDAEAGRGLLLIEALSSRWGSYAVKGVDGKFVWAVCGR
jgi:anti-sigma regulatory factor (Ser/Thr protein kinase)